MHSHCLIKGPSKPLRGKITIPASKNASMPILVAAALIKNCNITISNLPNISDIKNLLAILKLLGVSINSKETGIIISNQMDLTAPILDTIPVVYSSALRGSIYALAIPLLKYGHAKIGKIGGDKIEGRNWDPHFRLLHGFGIQLTKNFSSWNLVGRPKQNQEFNIQDNGITATSLAIIIAASLEGRTVIRNSSQEIENNDVIKAVNNFGANAYRDNDAIVVNGPMQPNDYYIEIPPDQVVWGTFAISTLLTGGKLLSSHNKLEEFVVRSRPIINALQESGANVSKKDETTLIVEGEIKNCLEISTGVHPKFPSDLVPQMMILMSQAPGVSVVIENLYKDRYGHVRNLRKIGADIIVSGNKAYIHGKRSKLFSAEIVDGGGIRESCAMILSGLIAYGETKVFNACSINRGYQNLVGDLSSLGADICWKQ
ncbi:hypothetical protein [Methanosarcina sp.]|uniref:hypothetical protein n=1 Tax=Methanosarcina sp. TaxID=2213 RepID=UPI003BB8130D